MTSRRSWQKHHVGYLHLTVETDAIFADQNLERHRNLANVSKQLVDLFDAHRLPATWAVGDPAHSATAVLAAISGVQHELALLGDLDWIGPLVGRTWFARELTRRVTQARMAGIDVVTLVPRVAPITEHVDLIVKHGIRAVVGVADPGGRQRTASTRALHYGVWEFSATERLPLRSSWLGGSGRRLYRGIRRAAADAATFHLAIDVPAMEQQGHAAMKKLASLMRHVALLRDRGLLRVETLAAASARLSDLPAANPQRSILRLAA